MASYGVDDTNGNFYITYYRMFDNKTVMDNPINNTIWVYLISHAAYQEYTEKLNHKDIILKRGQLIITLDRLSKICTRGITIWQVRKALKDFEKYNMIKIESSKFGTLITILNYEKYHPVKNNGVYMSKTYNQYRPTTTKAPPIKTTSTNNKNQVGWKNAELQNHYDYDELENTILANGSNATQSEPEYELQEGADDG